MWMNINVLKVNDDKTVALVHALRKKRRNVTVGPTAFKIGDCDMKARVPMLEISE